MINIHDFDEFAFISLVKWVKWRRTKEAAIPWKVAYLQINCSSSNYLLIGLSLICVAICFAITLEVLEQFCTPRFLAQGSWRGSIDDFASLEISCLISTNMLRNYFSTSMTSGRLSPSLLKLMSIRVALRWNWCQFGSHF